MDQRALSASDLELVDEVQRGVSEAEGALYEKYSPRIYFLALRELRSPADAEDVRAETSLRVLQAIRQNRLHSPQALPSFVLGTAKNVIREHLRQQRRTVQVDEKSEAEGGYIEQTELLDSDVKTAIEKVVLRLKAREQAFLRMYYFEELSNDEIARRLAIKPERLRLIKSRALKNFRKYYERLTKITDTKEPQGSLK
jgi:RNA polymerase sigma-70 factor (ECF subfamily)